MITPSQMKALEKHSRLSESQLMEHAGNGVVAELTKAQEIKGKHILVMCYHGNNGGDGFVVAQALSTHAEVDVLFIGDEQKLSQTSKKYFDLVNQNPHIQFISEQDEFDYDIIVDAMLGLGTKGQLKPTIAEIVKKINKTKAFIVSVDVPTGVEGDEKELPPLYVDADLIVTFHDTKPGLTQLKEKVKIVDIGL